MIEPNPFPTDIRIASLISGSEHATSPEYVQGQTRTFSLSATGLKKYLDISYANQGGVDGMSDLQDLPAWGKAIFRKAVADATLVTGIAFTEVDGSAGDANFYAASGGPDSMKERDYATAYAGKPLPGKGYIVLNRDINMFVHYDEWTDPKYPGYGMDNAYLRCMLHELGHTLGLSHPFDNSDHKLPEELDKQANTVMSYDIYGPRIVYKGYMEYDIRALFYLYGGDGYGGEYGVDSTHGPIVLDNVYRGLPNQNIIGSSGIDWMLAGAGNNWFNGGASADFMIGSTTTLSTAHYEQNRAKYTITYKASQVDPIRVEVDGTKTGEGVDVLRNVQRLRFSDTMWALDVKANEHAGEAVLLMGAVLGAQSIQQHPEVLGLVLSALDAGASLQSLCDVVVSLPDLATLAGGSDSTHMATYLLTNVMGKAPDAALTKIGADYIDTNGLANALQVLSLHAANQAHVGLVGLATTGVAYTDGSLVDPFL